MRSPNLFDNYWYRDYGQNMAPHVRSRLPYRVSFVDMLMIHCEGVTCLLLTSELTVTSEVRVLNQQRPSLNKADFELGGTGIRPCLRR